VQTQLQSMKNVISITYSSIEDVRSRGDDICDCLPPCSDTRYEPEISYASFPGGGFNLTRTFKRLVEGRNLSSSTDGTQYFK
jgi:hypothetical protein